MQPLISPVDHESRHGYYNAEDDIQSESEGTPLLPRFPRRRERVNVCTLVVVGTMIAILCSGFSIGVYLLTIEDDSENILPPVQMPPQYVARSQWDAMSPHFSEPVPVFKAKSVAIEHTETNQCNDEDFCIKLMKDLEDEINENKTLPYNFLISSDGYIYEYLGWEQPSPLYPDLYSLAIAFIGNFSEENPSGKQIRSAGNLIIASVSNSYLERNFTILSNNDTKLASGYIQKSLMDIFEAAMERQRLFMPRLYFLKSENN